MSPTLLSKSLNFLSSMIFISFGLSEKFMCFTSSMVLVSSSLILRIRSSSLRSSGSSGISREVLVVSAGDDGPV